MLFKLRYPNFRYSVSTNVLDKARKLGMYGDHEAVVQRLRDLAELATPISHPLGNALCERWLLKIEGHVVVDLVQLAPDGVVKHDLRPYRDNRHNLSPSKNARG
jgi:hypothetical protein